MSVPTSRQAFAFLAPLRGRTSVFLVSGRKRNSKVARFLLGCLASSRMRTVIFDTSSFYGTNVRTITESLPRNFLQETILITPGEAQKLEDAIAGVLTLKTQAIIIDDLNALHYLLSSDGQKSGIRKLFTILRMLSYEARIDNLTVFGTVYRAEGEPRSERTAKRSLPAAADLQIGIEDRDNRITFRCEAVKGWPEGRFSAPVYLEPRT